MDFHPIANIFPMLQPQELEDLATDIKANGLNHKITTYQNQILDGRNRFVACELAFVEPQFVEYTGTSPVQFVISENLKRRQLSPSQAAAVSLNALPFLEEEAKERQTQTQLIGKGIQQRDTMVSQKIDTPSGRATQVAADMFKTNRQYVSDAKMLKEQAPELFDAVAAGEINIPEAKKEFKRQETQQHRAALVEQAATIPQDERWHVWQADIRTWQAPHQYDFIITDPPYPKEYLPLYDVLAQRAKEWLTPGGLLIAMCGQSYLDEIYKMMSAHLNYWWTIAYITPGGQSAQIFPRKVNPFWKPVLVYCNGEYTGKWFGDVCKSDVNDNEKDNHEWGQSVSGMTDLVNRFAEPGQWILDPFCGSGTTGIAAIGQGCFFDGIDIDQENVSISRARIAGWK